MQFSISYLDLLDQIDICSIPSKKLNDENDFSINYFVQLDVFHTGYLYYTDEETKKIMKTLKEENKALARVNIKINNFNLLSEKVSNQDKLNRAKSIVKKIEQIKVELLKKKEVNKSLTTIPFYDIEYKTILSVINKNNEDKKLTSHKELQLLNRNMHIFERFFGFKFEKKSLIEINNQSLITLDNIYPEIKEFFENPNYSNLLDIDPEETESHKKKSSIDKLKKNDFKILLNKSQIINIEKAFKLEEYLPNYIQGISWKLYYSRYRDGTSYNTLHRLVYNKGSLMIIIKDEFKNIFGGYMTHGFDFKDGFFGTGESFLFKFCNDTVYVYNSSFNNDLYCFADEDGFGMGSDNHYGLFIDSSLRKGSTHICKTYLNDPLTCKSHFGVLNIEIWGFQDENY